VTVAVQADTRTDQEPLLSNQRGNTWTCTLRIGRSDITTSRGGTAGTGTWGWKEALQSFAIHFPNRLPL
jgi:hypothetical protein